MGRGFSDFMIGIVIVSMFVVSFVLIASTGEQHFSVSFNNASFSTYDKINETINLTNEIQSKSNLSANNNLLDIVGSVFSQGFTAIKIAANSFSLFDDMKNDAIDNSQLGPLSPILKVSITAIILIIIFVAILLRYVIKEKT